MSKVYDKGKKEKKEINRAKQEKAELANFLEIGGVAWTDNEVKIVFHPDFNFNEQI